MTNKELIDKIRNEILHLKMKELQRTNGINTGADVYLSTYAVLSILSNALTEESEDERIRKELINFLRSPFIKENLTDEKVAPWLEWLEKQKEQKPAEKQDYSGLNDLERAIHRGFLCAGVENVPVTIIKDTAAECMGFLALIEPKPAEWSEEDKKMIDTIVSALGQYTDYKVISGADTVYATSRYSKEIAWLKSLRPSWKPSDQDELMKLKYAGTSTKLD